NANGQVVSRTASITSTDGALAMQAGTYFSAATGIHVEATGALTAKALVTATGDLYASAGGQATFTTAAITATAGNDKITLKSTGGNLFLDSAAAQGTVELDASGIATLNVNGQAISRGANVAVTADVLNMRAGSELAAATGIHIATT